MNNRNNRGEQHIIYIMLNDNDKVNVITAKSSPTPPYIPPTHFFSVKESIPALCPPIF